jgi:TIGR03009 family protein
MRYYVITPICLLLAVMPLAGQNPEADDLDAVLGKWEKAMNGLQSYAASVQRTTLDKALDAKDVHRGMALLSKLDKKAGIQARLECTNVINPKSFEKYIYSGSDLYEYVPANSTIRHHKIAKNAKGVIEQDTLISLVLGMTVKHVKDRFDLKPMPNMPVDGYYYVIVQPKNAKDKQEFRIARLVFDRKNHLLAQVWFRQANDKEITWDFSNMQTNVQIGASHFEPKLPDASWKTETVRTPLVLPKVGP